MTFHRSSALDGVRSASPRTISQELLQEIKDVYAVPVEIARTPEEDLQRAFESVGEDSVVLHLSDGSTMACLISLALSGRCARPVIEACDTTAECVDKWTAALSSNSTVIYSDSYSGTIIMLGWCASAV